MRIIEVVIVDVFSDRVGVGKKLVSKCGSHNGVVSVVQPFMPRSNRSPPEQRNLHRPEEVRIDVETMASSVVPFAGGGILDEGKAIDAG